MLVFYNLPFESQQQYFYKLPFESQQQGASIREVDYYNSKIKTLEMSREEVVAYCNSLEQTLILLNQGFEKTQLNELSEKKIADINETVPKLELEDIQSDDDEQSSRR